METPYIYFEIYEVVGSHPEAKRMQRENFLVNKPDTNSLGVWGFRHVTERKGFDLPTHVIVDQYWIDLEKFKPGTTSYDELVKEFFDKMRDPREERIKEILNQIFEEDGNGEDVENVKIVKEYEFTYIDFDIHDRDREGRFNNRLKVHGDGSVTCWSLHEIWKGGDVHLSIEQKLSDFFKNESDAIEGSI